ncbi:hypothetical protein HYT05_03175 [Candidatus Kaiserbacteria bacterium]|nr:hypothetical protein [Candidatus Kaiserbacteria bacterium]
MGDVITGKFPPRVDVKNTNVKKGDSLLEKSGKRDTRASGQCWKIWGAFNLGRFSRSRGWIFLLRKEEMWTLRDVLTVRFVSQRRLSEMLTAGRYERLVSIMPLRKKVGMPGR